MSEVNKAAMTDSLPSGLAQVLGTIANGQAQMLDALVQMKQAPQKDPMDEMTKMLGMMSMMRQAMGMDNQPRGGSSISEILGAIRELRSAADEVAPQREEPETMMAMLPKVLDIVSAGMNKGQAQPEQHFEPVQLPPSFAQAQPQPEPQPQPQYQPNPEPQPAQSTEENDMANPLVIIKLKAYLKTLTDMAVALTPVDKAADFVYDKLPDDLIEIMLLDNWFDLLSGFAPAVKPHEAWLRQVRDKAMTMFEIEDEDESETSEPKVGGTD
jgi:hypothetical protein